MGMKVLIIYCSVHHGNTEKIVKAMAEVLDAEMVGIKDMRGRDLSEYGLIGFGSGIYFGTHHRSLLRFADKLPELRGKRGFIFSTSGIGNAGNMVHNIRLGISHYHVPLRKKLAAKGLDIRGEFNCRGFDTAGPLKIIGGIRKGRPDKRDIKRARTFAAGLLEKLV